MGVYSRTGTELNAIYDRQGNELDYAYDRQGNEIFAKSSPYSIENVVEYFRPSTLSVAQEVNALSSDWVSIVFVTDPHGSANKQHSQAITLYLLSNTNAAFAVLNGDYSASNWDKTQYDEWVAPFLASNFIGKIYSTLGNHETYGTGATAESKACIYADFLQNKSKIHGNPTDIYYYVDDSRRKIRYLFINTSDDTDTRMTTTQINWIQQKVALPDSDWSLVVFGHVNFDDLGGVTTMNEKNGAAIAAAIATSNGTVVGYFCGHQHIDGISTISGFHQAMLYCDRFENTNYYSGYSVTNREAGTVTEQAVSVISFNTTTKQVVIRRVGVRSPNQTLAYSY